MFTELFKLVNELASHSTESKHIFALMGQNHVVGTSVTTPSIYAKHKHMFVKQCAPCAKCFSFTSSDITTCFFLSRNVHLLSVCIPEQWKSSTYYILNTRTHRKRILCKFYLTNSHIAYNTNSVNKYIVWIFVNDLAKSSSHSSHLNGWFANSYRCHVNKHWLTFAHTHKYALFTYEMGQVFAGSLSGNHQLSRIGCDTVTWLLGSCIV